MANTFELISSVTVGAGGAASIDFTSIPSTYTDLVVKFSLRSNRGAGADVDEALLTFNGSTSSFGFKYLWGFGSGAPDNGSSSSTNAIYGIFTSTSNNTSNTFGNGEIYLPNYSGSNYKSISVDAVSENNATTAGAAFVAGLWSNTAAITSVKLAPRIGSLWLQYSTAYIYGVKNA